MRRLDRQMSKEDTIKALEGAVDGILGTISENGYPYAVPVNFAYVNGKIYLHNAFEGHKVKNIKNNELVSFTVVTRNEVLEDKFSTNYQSVIVFGKAKLIEPSKEILMYLIKKYSSKFMEKGQNYVNSDYMKTQLIEIEIDHMTGKERK